MKRYDGRRPGEMRPLRFQPGIQRHAHGSVLVCFGGTEVICSATIEDRQPRFLTGQNQGWVAAEYEMLPAATHTRGARGSKAGKPSGRSMEIERLIGRSLRAAVDLEALGPRTVTVDCDVLNADGGTRTAAITGGWVALVMALRKFHEAAPFERYPVRDSVCAVSAGILQGTHIVDLAYQEDSAADVDMNFVMTGHGRLVEVQGTAERGTFDATDLFRLVRLATAACRDISKAQRTLVGFVGRGKRR